MSSSSPKKTGRRPRLPDGSPLLSRTTIIQCAVELVRRESIAKVSMVRIARELGVAPGLIHYYLGSKEALLSAVINAAYAERMEALPARSNDWRADLTALVRAVVADLARWPGLATYIMTRNRFRLFQQVQQGETDYGLAFFDYVGSLLRDAGFSAEHAALVYHLLLLFATSVAVERENRQAPGEHRAFIENYVAQFDPQRVPGATFLVAPFAKLTTDSSFAAGIDLLLDGVAAWRTPAPLGYSANRSVSPNAA